MFARCWPYALFFTLVIGVAPISGHHDSHHSHGACDNCASTRNWAPSASRDERFEGTISEVLYLPGASSGEAMVEVRLATGTTTGQVIARLAPAAFLRSLDLDLREGLKIGVTGYWASVRGEDRLIVTRLTANGRAFTFRDTSGHCRW